MKAAFFPCSSGQLSGLDLGGADPLGPSGAGPSLVSPLASPSNGSFGFGRQNLGGSGLGGAGGVDPRSPSAGAGSEGSFGFFPPQDAAANAAMGMVAPLPPSRPVPAPGGAVAAAAAAAGGLSAGTSQPGEDLAAVHDRLMALGISSTYDPTAPLADASGAAGAGSGSASGLDADDISGKLYVNLSDPVQFAHRPAPKRVVVQCYIVRDKGGITSMFSSTFTCHFQADHTFLVAAKKMSGKKGSYYR